MGSPRWSTIATATPSRHRERLIGHTERPIVLGLSARRGRLGHPQPLAGVLGKRAVGGDPALEVVAVLARVRDPERVVDEQVLAVGGLSVGDQLLAVGPRVVDERPDPGAGGGDPGDHRTVAPDRHPARPREHGLGRADRESGHHRRRDHAEPVQVLGAADLLSGGDPRLRARARHAAGAAVIHPRCGNERAARADDGDAAAHRDVLGLVDRAGDQRARLGVGNVGGVAHA
jgi:hypothetical protein